MSPPRVTYRSGARGQLGVPSLWLAEGEKSLGAPEVSPAGSPDSVPCLASSPSTCVFLSESKKTTFLKEQLRTERVVSKRTPRETSFHSSHGPGRTSEPQLHSPNIVKRMSVFEPVMLRDRRQPDVLRAWAGTPAAACRGV